MSHKIHILLFLNNNSCELKFDNYIYNCLFKYTLCAFLPVKSDQTLSHTLNAHAGKKSSSNASLPSLADSLKLHL